MVFLRVSSRLTIRTVFNGTVPFFLPEVLCPFVFVKNPDMSRFLCSELVRINISIATKNHTTVHIF